MNTQKRIRIEHDDEAALNPRTDMCNLGTMACWHGRYELGDEQPSFSPPQHMMDLIEAHDEGFCERLDRRCDRMFNYMDNESARQCEEYRREQAEEAFDKYYISLPLYLFDHGGITMNTTGFSCPWDSGQVGFIYVSIADVKRTFDWQRMTARRLRQIEDILKAEVEVYDQFIRGEVYGFVIEDENGDVIDSCWGFFGRDPFENGMAENIDKELHPLLKEAV